MKRRGFLASLLAAPLAVLGLARKSQVRAVDLAGGQSRSVKTICVGKRPAAIGFYLADSESENTRTEVIPLDQLEKKRLPNGFWYWAKKE